MSPSEAERYAERRIADLTREIAACLTPETLAAVVDEVAENCNRPIAADLQTFARRLACEYGVLVEETSP